MHVTPPDTAKTGASREVATKLRSAAETAPDFWKYSGGDATPIAPRASELSPLGISGTGLQVYSTRNPAMTKHTAMGARFRLLTAFDPSHEDFRAWLSYPRDGDHAIIAQLEFHGTHPPGYPAARGGIAEPSSRLPNALDSRSHSSSSK
jgi:hypothetical protein